MIRNPALPTPLHQEVAGAVVDFFRQRDEPHTVLLIGSCARGKASPQSDLDMVVLTSSGVADRSSDDLVAEWTAFRAVDPLVQRFEASGPFAALHLDVCDGTYVSTDWDDGGGPDGFEVEIGNHIAYSAPVWRRGAAFDQLRSRWLPYYDEALRDARLEMVRGACLRDLRSVAMYVDRGLHFQAFDRLYKAFREFLQALFISRRTYPIAYNKWIREQVCELLGVPSLYAQLPGVLEVPELEGRSLLRNAASLEGLVGAWATA